MMGPAGARAPQRAEASRALGSGRGGGGRGRLPADGSGGAGAVRSRAGGSAAAGRCGVRRPAAPRRAAAGGSAFVLPPHLSARLGGTAQVGAGAVGSGGGSAEPGRGGKATPCCGGRSRGCGWRLHAGGCALGRRRGRRVGQVPCLAFPAGASYLVLLHRDAAARCPGEGRCSEVGKPRQPGRCA